MEAGHSIKEIGMKRALSLILTLAWALPLWAGKSDPMDSALQSISQYFDSKTYIADQRYLVEADLAIPGEILSSLQTAELSCLRLLRNEIAAKHGYLFDDKTLAKIFQGTSWYRPVSKNYTPKLNEFERYNLFFIEGKEKDILLKGEREIRGWSIYPPQVYPRGEEWPVHNKAELKVLIVSPTQVRCGGKIKVKVKVKNLGSNPWSPIGTTHTQEAGKYYVSSCWSDPKYSSEYFIVDQFPLPRVIRPGESAEAGETLIAPSKPGTYYLVFLMLQSMTQRFLDIHSPSAQYEYEHCPKVKVRVIL